MILENDFWSPYGSRRQWRPQGHRRTYYPTLAQGRQVCLGQSIVYLRSQHYIQSHTGEAYEIRRYAKLQTHTLVLLRCGRDNCIFVNAFLCIVLTLGRLRGLRVPMCFHDTTIILEKIMEAMCNTRLFFMHYKIEFCFVSWHRSRGGAHRSSLLAASLTSVSTGT